jgi:predicted nucleotidyltransferase
MNDFLDNIDSDNNLKTIKSAIRDLMPGAVIILFGSRARGRNHPMSDYDLLIIVDHLIDVNNRLQFQSKIRKELATKNILSDVIIQSQSDLEIKKNLPGHIVRTAFLEGVRL